MDTISSSEPKLPPTPLLLRINEAARLLSISRAMLYTLINRGEIDTVKCGAATRIPAAEIPRWITAHTVRRTEMPKGDNKQSP